MIFVDPEAYEGAWLQTALADDITVIPDARVDVCTTQLRTLSNGPSRRWQSAT